MLLLLAVLALVSALPAAAQCSGCGTAVGSIVSGETWTASGSPYCVNSDVMVVGLTIQSNVTVRFCGGYEFQVLGSLRVNGASNAPVVFTSGDTTNGWKGIVFDNAAAGSYFNCAIIERATNSGVRTVNTSLAFTNCVIRNNTAPVSGGGINASGAGLDMENCVVSNNVVGVAGAGSSAGGGIFVNGQTIRVSRCSFVQNLAQGVDASGGGIYANSKSVFNKCTIAGNYAIGYGSYGVGHGGGICGDGDCTLTSCSITGNKARSGDNQYNGYGLYFGSHYSSTSKLVMVNCSVLTNSFWDTMRSYAGAIHLVYTSAQLRNCLIAQNDGFGLITTYGQIGVVNCTVVNNTIAGCWQMFGNQLMITNSVVFFNGSQSAVGSVAYSDIQGGIQPGPGNISVNPALCPQNWSLLPGSPCIDAGSPDAIYNDACIDDAVCSPNSRGTARSDMGAYGGPGNCYWLAGDEPNLVTQPASQSSCLGQTVTFSAFATGADPLTYQWFFNSNLMAGQTNRNLVLTNLQSTNGGPYCVVASNLFGSVTSASANLIVQDACVDICMYAGLNIAGLPGRTYELRYTTDLSNTNFANWTFLATNTPPWLYIDTNSCGSPKRFYGVKLLP